MQAVDPMEKVLLVLAHPRRDSLTAQIADRFAATLAGNGCQVEVADLAAEEFDPVLREIDEPDWAEPDKVYSPTVMREMERIRRNDATVMIFPIYWWSMPGIMKGWVDRVWNNGFAYGVRKYPHRRVWLVGVAGSGQSAYAERHYDEAIRICLSVGLLEYCGVAEPRLELLHGALDGPEAVPEILRRAEALAEEFSRLVTRGRDCDHREYAGPS
jgi:putative NADPH-quinone reductase